jgi:hypothetical protein
VDTTGAVVAGASELPGSVVAASSAPSHPAAAVIIVKAVSSRVALFNLQSFLDGVR